MFGRSSPATSTSASLPSSDVDAATPAVPDLAPLIGTVGFRIHHPVTEARRYLDGVTACAIAVDDGFDRCFEVSAALPSGEQVDVFARPLKLPCAWTACPLASANPSRRLPGT